MGSFLPDLRKALKTNKIGQVKSLLSDLSARPMAEKLEVLEILALTPDKAALETLFFLTSDAFTDPEIHDRLMQLITDRAHLNFNFVFILFENGDSQIINQTIPLARHMLSNETDKALLLKLIRTAGKLGIEKLTDDIAEFIFYDDPSLKAQAIKALERIGTQNACQRLIQASKTEKCDQDILDAIEALSARGSSETTSEGTIAPQKPDTEDEDTLVCQLTSPDFQKRFDALALAARKGTSQTEELLQHFKDGNHDLTVNLLKLVKRTIPLAAVNEVLDVLHADKTDVSIKFCAYSALESFPELKSAASVLQGIFESALSVRLAAIRVLDKNLSDFVFAEIKNKIESGTKKGETLAETILDAQADHIIEQLMVSDTFSYMASNYLSRTAPIAVIDTFIDILEKRGLKATAKKYADIRNEKYSVPRPFFVVISSCQSVLKTYSKLISICGCDAKTFVQPQEAFEFLVAEKPAAVVCDLFLDEMTGFEIAAEVRELYGQEQVPMILSTSQKDLDSSILDQQMVRFGVASLTEFPAKTSQIKSWLK